MFDILTDHPEQETLLITISLMLFYCFPERTSPAANGVISWIYWLNLNLIFADETAVTFQHGLENLDLTGSPPGFLFCGSQFQYTNSGKQL